MSRCYGNDSRRIWLVEKGLVLIFRPRQVRPGFHEFRDEFCPIEDDRQNRNRTAPRYRQPLGRLVSTEGE